jgi:hypothetical protein
MDRNTVRKEIVVGSRETEMQNSKVKTTSTSAFTFLFSQCQSLRIGVR